MDLQFHILHLPERRRPRLERSYRHPASERLRQRHSRLLHQLHPISQRRRIHGPSQWLRHSHHHCNHCYHGQRNFQPHHQRSRSISAGFRNGYRRNIRHRHLHRQQRQQHDRYREQRHRLRNLDHPCQPGRRSLHRHRRLLRCRTLQRKLQRRPILQHPRPRPDAPSVHRQIPHRQLQPGPEWHLDPSGVQQFHRLDHGSVGDRDRYLAEWLHSGVVERQRMVLLGNYKHHLHLVSSYHRRFPSSQSRRGRSRERPVQRLQHRASLWRRRRQPRRSRHCRLQQYRHRNRDRASSSGFGDHQQRSASEDVQRGRRRLRSGELHNAPSPFVDPRCRLHRSLRHSPRCNGLPALGG